ncbi:bifunctional cytochrome P450/NADPH--P450 reductase CypB [Bacillus inaquosorum]|uniref:Bifunctional cytochrome P450/NADPH--P450 reductase n=1 Tax=Bacillus inaquosorum TaxID=483913 RepID=A0A9Q4EQC9_9BACI|nr:bifunctional cytochrome P450/NADPH--P450 reductase CypB [Bacillus inaquosorum]MCY7787904.1 bifunctional cytochrome P450/NADPH--P450 reductase CypB [Bacillus inaquosorum]MCY7821093.1 bifunctional cytochrome P450/NADPH--P450 reductase CypB [Bacillus inaquosorum]MCY7937349.1 bifunctional cytochrome P450/NADPH--P450 reductase CypB [Bacillus inaquosorum]MCY7942229.1 bifunctional cytochrome P450/NADPH--P450 reductase CypB [Bacillus inaquosorum]MCY7985394.1 bifunctional cytochrome P450/NADPH--P450
MKQASAIPQPKTYGPLKNLPHLEKEQLSQSLWRLADELGPIFRFDFPGVSSVFVSGHNLVAEVCDESRFDKNLGKGLLKVREFGGDGLFTSWTHEPNWQKAHRILLPSFSQKAMKGYHSMMLDIATQLIQKWSRLNPNEEIDVADDMTRLTLDTIGLCGFNYRFNSFYRDSQHPFITSMLSALKEAMNQSKRLGLQDKMMVKTKLQFQKDIEVMNSLVDRMIAERKENPDENIKDLLSLMLYAKDPVTGETLDDENIRYQIITFLIAGHETTSGLLSFAIYCLLTHPEKLKKAQEEADRVLTDTPEYKQIQQLKYIRMVLNETLRLYPTAPAFSLYAKEDTVLGGEYPISKGQPVTVLIPKLHRDHNAWGEDAEDFRPERFEDPSSIPHHAYKPFGNGQRACIGMQFALQEATMVLGLVLKHFDLMNHTGYELKIKEALTIKPDEFKITVKPRKTAAINVQRREQADNKTETKPKETKPKHGTPLLVLYGSNLGTAEGIAGELAAYGRQLGFTAETAPLDDYIGKLPEQGAVVIVTASYNGAPPDNAAGFVEWLEELEEGRLKGVSYAVFGCGNRSWASTYQRIPRLIDDMMQAKGASRLTPIGEGDAADDFESHRESWENRFWKETMEAFDISKISQKEDRPSLSITFLSEATETPLAKAYGAFEGIVLENRELQTADSPRSTRHIELQVPDAKTYKEGDHIGILPKNSQELVQRVLSRFGLQSNHVIKMSGSPHMAHLPMDRPIKVADLLSSYVELQEPASRLQLRELASYTVCPPHKKELEQLVSEDGIYKEQVLEKRLTMLDLLEDYPACEMPFERFLELLPSLKPRYYSISSSPKVHANIVSMTVGVVKGSAWSGRGEYRGVASNYLAELNKGDAAACFIRTPQSGFQVPDDPETPMIMVGPGTGIAPFRGFIQARSVLKKEGNTLGEALLYFGCRRPDHDDLYREELDQAEQDGLVTVRRCYSRVENESKEYVQHLLKLDAQKLISLIEKGAHIYVCGDGSRMAPEVENTLRLAYEAEKGANQEESAEWLMNLQNQKRYVKDVWSGM